MGTEHRISERHFIARAATAGTCLLLLSGCMTKGDRNKAVAEASEPAPDVIMRSPAEQLAADLNAKAQLKAQAQSQKQQQVAYHDPQVRTVAGQQMVVQQQSTTGLFPAQPQAPAPAATAMAPANIGGLVTQPTAVNANRSSIYSAPPPIATNPDGTLAPVSNYSTVGAQPALRSVYSTPAGMAADQPPVVVTPPADQSAQSPMPHYTPQVASASVGRPTADATPSRILPAPGSKGRHIDSQEALMMARNMASGNQKPTANTMMPQASSGLTLPQGVTLPPGVTLTPGMAASIKQPAQ